MVPRAAADAAAVEAMRAALHGKADTAQLAAVHDSVTASLHEVRVGLRVGRRVPKAVVQKEFKTRSSVGN
jgi:hypothetical protein